MEIRNNTESKFVVSGHKGLRRNGVTDNIPGHIVEKYKKQFQNKFADGKLEVVDSGGSESSGDTSSEDEVEGYKYGDVHHATLKADIESGVYDEELGLIVEEDDRGSVVEAAENRLEEL